MNKMGDKMRSKFVGEKDAVLETSNHNLVASCNQISKRILTIRGVQVMLDRDLAELYGVELKVLNQAVKRNAERFPERFMHQLTKEEFVDLKSQIVTSSQDSNLSHLKSQFVTSSWGGVRKLPKVFTEQGVSMLSAVLHSPTAIDVSIRIMDAFVAMCRYLMANGQALQQIDQLRRRQILDQSRNEKRFDTVFTALADGHLLPRGILPAGAEFDALRKVEWIIEGAKRDLVIVDPYSDATTLDVLAGRRSGVTIRLVCKDRGKPTPTEIAKFNRQYKGLTVSYSDDFHDRFILVDGAELHSLGSSINCLGRRVTTYSTRDRKEVSKFLALLSSIPMK